MISVAMLVVARATCWNLRRHATQMGAEHYRSNAKRKQLSSVGHPVLMIESPGANNPMVSGAVSGKPSFFF